MIGQRILQVGSTDSTNNLAASIGEPGLVVVADYQTAGRGQFQRVWRSEPGESLLMSVVLAPPPFLMRPSLITAWAAVAVSRAVVEITQISPRLKWPNDLLIRGKKISGILTEQQNGLTVVGIGLNLNQTEDCFHSRGLLHATSLSQVSRGPFNRLLVMNVLISHLNWIWSRFLNNEFADIEAEWQDGFAYYQRLVEIQKIDGQNVVGVCQKMNFQSIRIATENAELVELIPEAIRSIREL